MAATNPFDLLGDDDNDDPTQLIATQQQKIAAKKPIAAPTPPAAKLPSKPLPPAQAMREARGSTAPTRGGGERGRGGRGGGTTFPNRHFGNANTNGFRGGYGGGGGGGGGGEDGDVGRPPDRERGPNSVPRPPFRGGSRNEYGNREDRSDTEQGGYGNRENRSDTERPARRAYERHSGTGHGYEMKREGARRGNWGTVTDDALAQEIKDNANLGDKIAAPEKQPEHEDASATEASKDKERQANEAEEKEEEKEMTLDEYEKIREEKRKALIATRSEERKVDFDKDLESMQQLSLKKGNDDIFIKLNSDKDTRKKKENIDQDERAKKPMNINNFLKPAEGERFYSPGSHGRGRGRTDRGAFRGGFGGGYTSAPAPAPSIEDPRHFPTLGGK